MSDKKIDFEEIVSSDAPPRYFGVFFEIDERGKRFVFEIDTEDGAARIDADPFQAANLAKFMLDRICESEGNRK